MKIVFASNYFNHHQKPFSNAMYNLIGDGYHFIETEPMSEERLQMGWGGEDKPNYIKQNYTDENSKRECQKLIDEADVVMHGSAPYELITQRLKSGKLTFIYSERIYKAGVPYYKLPWHFILNTQKYRRYKNLYLLCASAYTSADFAKTFTFIHKAFNWGYFPQFKPQNVDELFARKRANKKASILWVARLIGLKHPDASILLAERLKKNGYDFELNFIGNGELEEQLKAMIRDKNLEDCVHMLGAMSPEAVREHMEAADIFLFTSDFNEGWGAVLNESMNSGCAVVASHAIGSVPFLLEDGKNGFIYKNADADDLYDRVVKLIERSELREQMGRNAYYTLADQWNADVAAERFLQLANALLESKSPDLFEKGPCSRAKILKNGWYKE